LSWMLWLICALGAGVAVGGSDLVAATPDPASPVAAGVSAAADSGGVAVADSAHKYRFLAKAARQQRDLDKALAYYLQLLQYAPDDLKASYFSGKIFLDKKRILEGKRAFLHAIQLDSLHLNSNLALTQLFLAEGKADSAWIFLNRVLRAKPGVEKYRQYRRKLADLYRKRGTADQAIEHYTALTAGANKGELAELYDLLARLQEGRGDTRGALDWRLRLAAFQKKSAVTEGEGQPAALKQQCVTLDQIVDLQVALRDFQLACQTLRQLVALDTGNSYSYYSRMTELAVQGEDRAAELEGLEGMAHASPRDLETLYVLIEFHMAGDDLSTAFSWVEKGLGGAPDDAHLQLLKGDLHSRQGEEILAIAAYEMARGDPVWQAVAQQRIWQLRPPETKEEKLKREFFGTTGKDEVSQATDGN
ncbi:MAG TPA: tetratricopeptide repeat protein, partial [Candidatus Latescibacteria bacterium]|nr:tetratricopeptide repeat protein [Candidatus Latescibacterota bacterium]